MEVERVNAIFVDKASKEFRRWMHENVYAYEDPDDWRYNIYCMEMMLDTFSPKDVPKEIRHDFESLKAHVEEHKALWVRFVN